MTAVAIAVTGLSKRYGTVNAVDDLHFQIPHGTVYGLLGGNGAGKTTTIAMLLGLLLPTSGRIEILGEDMLKNRYRVLPRMNFSSPYVDLPQRLTVLENLRVYGRLYGVHNMTTRLAELNDLLAIEPFLKRRYGSLSAGQRTRVSLAKALLNRPDVLLLDEPTASLDPDNADRVRDALRRYQLACGATVLLTSHNMPEVERLCQRVIILRRGQIVDNGSPNELLARYGRNTLEQVFLDIARHN